MTRQDPDRPVPADSGTPPVQRGIFAGRTIGRIGYGAMQLAAPATGTSEERDRAIDVLQTAVEHGVDHIDTAAFYGAGAANALIRAALAPYRDDLLLATKVGCRWDAQAGALVPAQQPQELRAAVEDNLRSLGVDRLDLVNLRRMDSGRLVATGDQVVSLDDQLAELIGLREEGKVAALGISQVDIHLVQRALPAGIVGVQNLYNVLDRSHEPIERLCGDSGIAFVPYFPLGSGVSHLPRVTENATVVAIAAQREVTPAQVAIAWLLARGPHVFPIPGTRTTTHLLQNLAAGSVELQAPDLAALNQLASQPDHAE